MQPLTMSMFASKADLDKAIAAQHTGKTPITVRSQGTVQLEHGPVCLLFRSPDYACIVLDTEKKTCVETSTPSESDCPTVLIRASDNNECWTELEFTDFPGWQVHTSRAGKSVVVAFTTTPHNAT